MASFRLHLNEGTKDRKIRDYQDALHMAKLNFDWLKKETFKNQYVYNCISHLSGIEELQINLGEYSKFEYSIELELDKEFYLFARDKIKQAEDVIHNLIAEGPTGKAY